MKRTSMSMMVEEYNQMTYERLSSRCAALVCTNVMHKYIFTWNLKKNQKCDSIDIFLAFVFNSPSYLHISQFFYGLCIRCENSIKMVQHEMKCNQSHTMVFIYYKMIRKQVSLKMKITNVKRAQKRAIHGIQHASICCK